MSTSSAASPLTSLCQYSHPEFPHTCYNLTLNTPSLARALKFVLCSIQERLESVPLTSHSWIVDCLKTLLPWTSIIRWWNFIVPAESHCQCPTCVLYLGLYLLLHSPQSHGIALHETIDYPTCNFYLKSGHCPSVLAFFVQTPFADGTDIATGFHTEWRAEVR